MEGKNKIRFKYKALSISICVDWRPSVFYLVLYRNQSSRGVSSPISGLPLTHFLSPIHNL